MTGVLELVRDESNRRSGYQLDHRGDPLRRPYTWRFHLLVVGLVGTTFAGLVWLQDTVWPPGGHPSALQDQLWPLTFLWVLPLALGVLSVAGMLLQKPPPTHAPYLHNTVVFRFVSRGQNVETLAAAVDSVLEAMAAQPLFPCRIELVVERAVPIERPGVVQLRVPRSYTCRNGTLFKARALQFALERAELPADAWIFHCDEESHVTSSLVEGIARAIEEEERSGAHRIGQGCVLYHHTLRDNPVLTLADSIRTGDDVGRWHLQNRFLQRPVLGMHGSFVLVRQSVEAAIGYDDGPACSITEDAWWALKATAAGHRTRWVDGFLVEQAPERARDLMRQRRRWMTGLRLTARKLPVPLRWRLPLAFFVVTWSLSPLALLFTLADLALGIRAPFGVQLLGDVSYACYVAVYVVGLRMTLRDAPVGVVRTGILYVLQVVLMPLFAALEGLGSLWAIVAPARDFYVIKKSH